MRIRFPARVRPAALVLILLFSQSAGPGSAEPLTEPLVVSTETCSGLWIVPLVWTTETGEPRDLVAVFDTGAEVAYIDPDALERLSGRRIDEGTRVRMNDVSVAGRPFSTFRPKVKDLDHLSGALARQIDVFLPFEAFSRFLLVLDYPAGEMRIEAGSLPEPDDERIFDGRGPDDRPWLRVQVGRIERRLLIDSGASGGISVRDHRKLAWRVEPAPLRLVQRMTEVKIMGMGRLAGEARIGALPFTDPLISLTGDTELFGAQVLQHFVATFDQANRRVRLDPAIDGPVITPALRGLGALYRPRGGEFEIAYVVPGSAAAAADLAVGDRVTHLDGVPVDVRGCREIDPPVTTTALTVVRDGASRSVVLDPTVLVP